MCAICTETHATVVIAPVEVLPHDALTSARLRAILDKFGVISIGRGGRCFIIAEDIPATREALASELALGVDFRPLDA